MTEDAALLATVAGQLRVMLRLIEGIPLDGAKVHDTVWGCGEDDIHLVGLSGGEDEKEGC